MATIRRVGQAGFGDYPGPWAWLSGADEFSFQIVQDLGDGEGIGVGGGFGGFDAAAEVGDHFADVGVAEEGLNPEDGDAALTGLDGQHLVDAVGGVGEGVAGGELDGLPW